MQKRRILYVITKSNFGGAQRYVFDLATELPKDAYDVTVALGGWGELAERLTRANITVLQIPSMQRDVSLRKEVGTIREMWHILRSVKPDILHVNSSKAGALGAILGRLLGVRRIVFTALGLAFNEQRPRWQKMLMTLIYWLTVFCSHETIAISHGIKEQMRWPLVQKKITVIHLGRRVSSLLTRNDARAEIAAQRSVREIPEPLENTKDMFWIGSLSELHPIKQLDRAIDAVSRLTDTYPSLRYVIIGEGQERPRLEEMIRSLKMEGRIYLVGAIPDAGKLLAGFDIFLFPSRSEAFGYVLLEAGAAGVPVVATRVGGIMDVVTDKETGLLVSRDSTDELTEALKTLIGNETLRTKLAQAHHAKTKEFTVERMLEKTLAVYQ